MESHLSHRPHILVVEDSETQAIKLRFLLEEQGFSVKTVVSAEAGLESFNERLPDLVIADLHLPGMDGNEFVRNLRINAPTRAIPVLMFTGSQEQLSERLGLDSGADAYVSKSADWDLIVLRLKALLRRRSQELTNDVPESSAATTTFRRARLVLADSNIARRDVLQSAISYEGYAVELADTLASALLLAQQTPPDAVLIHTDLGYSESLEACRRLNALRVIAPTVGQDPPAFQIVLIGAEADKRTLTDAFAAGVDDVVSTEIDAEGLRIRIRTLVRRKLLQDEDRRLEAELRDRDRAIAIARSEAEAAEARASLSDALARANVELAAANERLKDAQGKLIHSAKMASLGELVAGIAHEINNPLAFILAHQQTIERLLSNAVATGTIDPAKLSKANDRVAAMRIGLQRIQDLVLSLRKFSRFDEGDFENMNVSASLDTVISLLAPKLTDRVSVERDYAGEEELFCSPALFNQVVMNIIGNAADAIEGKGVIRVTTRSDDTNYFIHISDSGAGMPDHVKDRVFEPFFTTKPLGSGTGLGLAIAYGVVEAHGGLIAVEDGPDGGTLFKLNIPLRQQQRGNP
jgi:two-component system NtrC family sensor kinase